MIVVDTNLVAYLWMRSALGGLAQAVLQKDPDWAAPLLWRSEFRSFLAGEMSRGSATYETALRAARDAEAQMMGGEYAVDAERVLRLVATSRCSAYDCEFVALADDLGVPLVTSDRLVLAEFPDLARSPEAFVEGG